MEDRKFSKDEIANYYEIPLLEDLECRIDLMISMNPFMCKKCQTVFCQDCSLQCKKSLQECPMRCKPFDYVSLDNTILKSQINKIRLYCCFKAYGCQITPLVFEKEKHEKVCEYMSEKCLKCQATVSKAYLNEHHFRKCEKLKIKCLNCEVMSFIADYPAHLELCTKKYTRCEYCYCKILIQQEFINDNDDNKRINNEKDELFEGYGSLEHKKLCRMNISICGKCQLPEYSKLIATSHSHSQSDEENNFRVTQAVNLCNFYKLMTNIEEGFHYNIINIEDEKNITLKSALEIYEFIVNEQNKYINGHKKALKSFKAIEERELFRIKSENNNINRDLENEIELLEYKLKETNNELNNIYWMINSQLNFIESKQQNLLNMRMERINELFSVYYELGKIKPSQIIHKFDDSNSENKNIINCPINFSNANNYSSSISFMSNSFKKPQGLSPGAVDSKVIQDSSIQINNLNNCRLCNGNTELSTCDCCKYRACSSCTTTCQNENSDHADEDTILCKECIKLCSLCGLNSQCIKCSKKCFYKDCHFYFCNFCSEKNKHQIRPQTTNCKFYKCESCNIDANCIMNTLYCSICDRRICRNCLQSSHMSHIKFR